MHAKYSNVNLNYHDFSGTGAKYFSTSKYTIELSQFLCQLDALTSYKNNGLTDLVLADNSCEFNYSLTFDDGRKSNLIIAEELAKRKLVATFFIIKNECQQNKKYLSVQEIKELSKLGMEIGSHSCTHRHLNRLPDKEMLKELRESKLFLEDITSKPVHSIAYPGGHCGLREFKAALNEGYKINRTCIIGINKLPLCNGIVKSINVKSNMGMDSFIRIINRSPIYFLKLKIRERSLAFPKFIHSKYFMK